MESRVTLRPRILQDENANVKPKSTIPFPDSITFFYLYELEMRVLSDSDKQKSPI